MAKSKPAMKSLGVWGGMTGLMALFYKLVGIVSDLPADLITDTQAFIVATVAALIALFGRWRAVLPIDGIIKEKK